MKKISLELEGMDGNAFVILGSFRRQAKKEGWSLVEIARVSTEAQSGDYNHLLKTIMEHCK